MNSNPSTRLRTSIMVPDLGTYSGVRVISTWHDTEADAIAEYSRASWADHHATVTSYPVKRNGRPDLMSPRLIVER